MENTIRTWFAKGKGGGNNNINAHEYFIQYNCLSCGWSLGDLYDRESITTLDDYKISWKEHVPNKKWGRQGVHQLFDNLKKGDFVWTRSNGIYYLAQIPDEPKKLFYFDSSDKATEYDCSAQIRGIQWQEIGKEDVVPGNVSVFTSNRSALLRIDNNEDFFEYSGENFTCSSFFSKSLLEDNFKLELQNKHAIFNMLNPSSVEDIVALWLYDQFNYVTIPSTSKLSTQLYEFVLVDGTKKQESYKHNRKIFIQVKNGKTNIDDSKNYLNLLSSETEELWLITTGGKIKELESNDYEKDQIIQYKFLDGKKQKVNSYDINDLIDFIFNPDKKFILPEVVLNWINHFNL